MIARVLDSRYEEIILHGQRNESAVARLDGRKRATFIVHSLLVITVGQINRWPSSIFRRCRFHSRSNGERTLSSMNERDKYRSPCRKLVIETGCWQQWSIGLAWNFQLAECYVICWLESCYIVFKQMIRGVIMLTDVPFRLVCLSVRQSNFVTEFCLKILEWMILATVSNSIVIVIIALRMGIFIQTQMYISSK